MTVARSSDSFCIIATNRTSTTLPVPVLLLSGGKNAGGFNDFIDGHLQRLVPDVERVIIPEASHEMFLDLPETSVQTLLEFFRRH